MSNYIYSATFYVKKPCGVIGCSCATGKRYISFSHKPSKTDLLKHEPHLERVEVEKVDMNYRGRGERVVIRIEAFKKLHKGINGRKTDGYSRWFGVLRKLESY